MSMTQILEFVSFEENDVKNKLFMRNDIFSRLRQCEELEVGEKRKARYDAESYSYLVLLTYLYRNCKYLNMENVKLSALKSVIGFNEKYKKIDFLLKENGVLDKYSFTETVFMRDMPMIYSFKDNELNFTSWSEYDESGEFREMIKDRVGIDMYSNKIKGKIPVDAVYSRDNVLEEGTMFFTNNPEAIDNTHEIDLKLFFQCMSNKHLGCKAFYVYNYINSLPASDGKVEVSLKAISDRTGISEAKVDDVLHYLKAHNLIHCNPRNYIIGVEVKGANKYKMLGSKSYSEELIDYEKRKVIFVKDKEDPLELL